MPTNQVASIHIEGIPPINDAVDLTLDPRANLLIGPNGCGKSTVLRALMSALRDPESWTGSPFGKRPVQIDLLHELREIASAKVPSDFPQIRSITGHHSQLFKQAELNHDYFATGQWRQYLDLNGELPPYLRIPFVYVPATRLPFPRKDDIVSAYVLSEDTVSDDVFDSRRVFRDMERFEDPDPAADLATIAAEEYIQLELGTHTPGESFDEWKTYVLWPRLREAASARKDKMLDVTANCAARICADILKPQPLSEHSHSTESGLRGQRGIQRVGYPHWRPHTLDDRADDPMTIGELSAGTQGPLMWIWHLVSQLHDFFVDTYRHRLTHHQYCKIGMFPYYVSDDGDGNEWLTPEQFAEAGSPPGYKQVHIEGFTQELLSWEEYRDQSTPLEYCAVPTSLPDEPPDEWQRMPFILLIDEIENHLHPAWQRRVIPALLETFPRMQLIATTHSPFVVAGREAGQVHRLFRDDDGKVRAATSSEDIVGWSVEDILQEFMEIDDPTDEDTAVAGIVLRRLRDQYPDEAETAEDWRQQKIAELSRSDTRASFRDLVMLGWLERLPPLEGEARPWFDEQIERLEEQVSPNLEFGGRHNAEREQYLSQLEEILWQLEDRLGEDLLGG